MKLSADESHRPSKKYASGDPVPLNCIPAVVIPEGRGEAGQVPARPAQRQPAASSPRPRLQAQRLYLLG
jgi:hypothetical protein